MCCAVPTSAVVIGFAGVGQAFMCAVAAQSIAFGATAAVDVSATPKVLVVVRWVVATINSVASVNVGTFAEVFCFVRNIPRKRTR